MGDVSDGMSAAGPADVAGARWVKSTRSGPTGGNCVEVAFLADGRVAVRDSGHPNALALAFPAAEWATFVVRARDGEFG